MKVPLENTFVSYEDNDFTGELLAYITLTPIYVMVMYTTLVTLRRDFSTVYALVGQMMNLIMNKLLKKLFNQPRPEQQMNLSDSGMPSNHSQFILFFSIFYSIQFLHAKQLQLHFRILYSFLLMFLAILVCYSRYYLLYHTLDQIFVGAVVGSTFAYCWAKLDFVYGRTMRNFICKVSVGRWLGIRDFSPLQQYLSLRENKGEESIN